jgi:arylsulfatase A-like enzyme
MRDEVEAKSIRVQLNEKEVVTINLEQGISQLVDIVLPQEKIKRGNNWIEFFYIVDDEDSPKEPVTPDEKRKFSLVVYDLVLSSHPDLGFSKKYHQAWQSLKPDMKPGSIVQKVPSILDFYLDIPENAVLEARGAFYPTISSLPSEDEISLDVSVQKPEKEEKIIHTQPDIGGKDLISLDLPVSDKGIARLRLKAGDETKEGALDGFLIWSDVRVIGQPKKGEPVVSQDVLSRYRDTIADKNIVFFIFDAARADHFSAYGYFRPTTPNTDKFAQNSTVFTNAYSEAISTRCSMGTLFTGFPLTVTSLTRITSGLAHELTTLAQLFRSHGFKTTGYTGIGNVASVFGFDRGFDQYFELYKEEGFYRKSQQYLPYVIPWLKANKDRKFFLYIHFKEPHAVYKPLPPFHGMFSGAYEEKTHLGKYHEMSQELSESQVEYIRACYDENLASVDSVFGTIMDKISELGLDENTIVILTADHGDLLGENGRLFGHGDYFGEGVTHIPLFIRFPRQDGLEVPKKIAALVKLSDLFATLADGYRFDVPWHLIGGKSLLPVIAGAVQEVNPFVVVEKRDRKGFCIRTKQHKLILWDDAPLEFYDLADDPQAENNIYRREDVMANYMLVTLEKWIAAQELIKEVVLGKDALQKDIGYDQIDKETLENLKALGYIK